MSRTTGTAKDALFHYTRCISTTDIDDIELPWLPITLQGLVRIADDICVSYLQQLHED